MNKIKKICFPFVGDTLGGSHLSAISLIKKLEQRNIEVVIIVHERGLLAEYLNKNGISFVYFPGIPIVKNASIPRQMLKMLFSASMLIGFIRKNQISIVHTNDARMHLTWSLATRLSGAKHIWHQRSAENSRRLAIYTCIANRVVTISIFTRNAFPALMKKRALVISNPFDIDFHTNDRAQCRSNILNKLEITQDVTMIGFVGNFTVQKRPLLFIEIAAIITSRINVPLVFVMVGEVRDLFKIDVEERLLANSLTEKIFIVGSQHPIEPWLKSFDIVIAPAVAEGHGRVLVESMLVGTPVIASKDGGHKEIIKDGETGMLVEPDNALSFSNAIIKMLEDSSIREKISINARSFALKTFSAERHADLMLDLYESL